MLGTPPAQGHVAYEVIGNTNPRVVVIDFETHEIAGARTASELSSQLESLIRPDLPRRYVIDFNNVRFLGSSAFAAIVSFARKAGRPFVCNLPVHLRLGAALIGLGDFTVYAADRQAAVDAARRIAFGSDDDTDDYPVFGAESASAGSASSTSA